jgi:hypothetical protein
LKGTLLNYHSYGPQGPNLPQQPLPHQRFAAWYGRMWRKNKALTLIATIVIVLFSCAICSTVGNASNRNAALMADTPTPQVTQLSLKSRVQTDVAQMPTPTPKPTPSRAQVDQLAGELNDVTVSSYDQGTGALVVEVDYGWKVPLSQSQAKTALQNMQTHFWQSSYSFSQVTTNAMQYQQNRPLTKVAYAILRQQTASKINFAFNFGIWDQFDEKWVDPTLSAI